MLPGNGGCLATFFFLFRGFALVVISRDGSLCTEPYFPEACARTRLAV